MKSEITNNREITLGDDPVCSFDSDWFGLKDSATILATQLHNISKSSGVCCGIVGPWGCGKSSFMKLVEQAAKERYRESVCFSWFTAWDPGGIDVLGDAMLYRFFQDIEKTSGDRDLNRAFKELQEALGVRKTIKDRAHGILSVVSKSIPDNPVKPVLDIAQGLLEEFESNKKVKVSFDKLVEWLKKTKKTAFFFVDDLDRAMGEQIRDILSELKVYVSHPRIIVMVGYDNDYVTNALAKPVLPPGTDPKKYLEKIVTINRQIPIPQITVCQKFATGIVQITCGLDNELAESIGLLAIYLTSSNPRRLKRLIQLFAGYVSGEAGTYLRKYMSPNLEGFPQKVKDEMIARFYKIVLVVVAASSLGVFSDNNVLTAFEIGHPKQIKSALREFNLHNPAEINNIQLLLKGLESLESESILDSYKYFSDFVFRGVPSSLGFCSSLDRGVAEQIWNDFENETRERESAEVLKRKREWLEKKKFEREYATRDKIEKEKRQEEYEKRSVMKQMDETSEPSSQ